MDRLIIHVDMDAFYASVEARDDPALAGKPLIIGALPQERGVVATCSYEARKFGVHSAMNIKDAYRLCPQGIYMHPDMKKYKLVSSKLHEIWNAYADVVDTMSYDFLRDVLMLLCISLEARLRRHGMYARTATLKLTYSDMRSITRSQSGESIRQAYEIFMSAIPMLKGLLTNSVRLIGISLQNLSDEYSRQLTFADLGGIREKWLSYRWKKAIWNLQRKYDIHLFPGASGSDGGERLYDVISHMSNRMGRPPSR